MLGCLLASPTVVVIAGEPRLVDRLRLGDFGLLLSEGALALGHDPDSRDTPEWADEEFYGWLTGEGVGLFLWCVLRRNWPGLTLADCERLGSQADTAEIATAYRAAMRRRKSAEETLGVKTDISHHRWGKTIRLLRASHSYAAISELTLDQIDLDFTRPDDADAEADAEDSRLLDELQRQWEAAQAIPPPVDVGPIPEGVTADVAADVAAMGLKFAPEGTDGG